MYADVITDSMRATIDETNRHRAIQIQYNKDNNITPKQIRKGDTLLFPKKDAPTERLSPVEMHAAAEPSATFVSKKDIEREIAKAKAEMEKAAKKLDFINAAKFRDLMFDLQSKL